jgi:hypothetical protein
MSEGLILIVGVTSWIAVCGSSAWAAMWLKERRINNEQERRK